MVSEKDGPVEFEVSIGKFAVIQNWRTDHEDDFMTLMNPCPGLDSLVLSLNIGFTL